MPKNKFNKKWILVAVISFAVVLVIWKFFGQEKYQNYQNNKSLPPSISYQDLVAGKPVDNEYLENNVETTEEQKKKELEEKSDSTLKNELPNEVNLDVPFTAQAPYADWSLPYKEACEEASVLMTHYYYQGKSLNKDTATTEINNIVDWQNENFGYYLDTNAAQTLEIAKKMYGYTNGRLIYDLTANKIKNELVKGNPVIIPAAGRNLGNPYFQNPGPLYHMLVIKGYNSTGFITNDPGTRRGHNFIYAEDVLLSAVADWTGERPDGQKIGIVFE